MGLSTASAHPSRRSATHSAHGCSRRSRAVRALGGVQADEGSGGDQRLPQPLPLVGRAFAPDRRVGLRQGSRLGHPGAAGGRGTWALRPPPRRPNGGVYAVEAHAAEALRSDRRSLQPDGRRQSSARRRPSQPLKRLPVLGKPAPFYIASGIRPLSARPDFTGRVSGDGWRSGRIGRLHARGRRGAAAQLLVLRVHAGGAAVEGGDRQRAVVDVVHRGHRGGGLGGLHPAPGQGLRGGLRPMAQGRVARPPRPRSGPRAGPKWAEGGQPAPSSPSSPSHRATRSS